MTDNVLTEFSKFIPCTISADDILLELTTCFANIDNIYSYLVYTSYKNEEFVGWKVKYTISQNEKYNTLRRDYTIPKIFKIIVDVEPNKRQVIGYDQPPIELMLELYKPLMHKMALEQSERWNDIEYEDALSMCKLCMLKLYKKGYYIHKSLLKKTYLNEILMFLRSEKDKPEILSLESIIHDGSDGETLRLIDVLADEKVELKKEREELDFMLSVIFNEVKKMLLEFLTERQFDQLLRDYGNKHTTSWSRKKMQQIKDKFKRKGINWKYFERLFNE